MKSSSLIGLLFEDTVDIQLSFQTLFLFQIPFRFLFQIVTEQHALIP
ncbi:hypothetical protein VHARVF571_120070 [Vibrio harveyi]|nr:hypothetical protein VHARVF571_120070 [Vibrio harveyi]